MHFDSNLSFQKQQSDKTWHNVKSKPNNIRMPVFLYMMCTEMAPAERRPRWPQILLTFCSDALLAAADYWFLCLSPAAGLAQLWAKISLLWSSSLVVLFCMLCSASRVCKRMFCIITLFIWTAAMVNRWKGRHIWEDAADVWPSLCSKCHFGLGRTLSRHTWDSFSVFYGLQHASSLQRPSLCCECSRTEKICCQMWLQMNSCYSALQLPVLLLRHPCCCRGEQNSVQQTFCVWEILPWVCLDSLTTVPVPLGVGLMGESWNPRCWSGCVSGCV